MLMGGRLSVSKIFLTSDTHFGHDREFIWKVRGFNSVEEMNETIVQKWNETVSAEDDVYILGDVILGDPDNIEYVKRLNGKLHIVLGNHDTAKREEIYRNLPSVVEVAEVGIRLKYKKHHFVLTHYPMMTGNLEKESLKQMSLNLYGHTHQAGNFYNDMPFMYHVGVDSHDCYPVLLDDIIEEMYAKVRECVAFLDEEPAESVVPVDQSRCGKCVYEVLVCGENDFYGNCPKYKRDPPDGGFYG
jgi:calcineurin-like phosphoesterase family protein